MGQVKSTVKTDVPNKVYKLASAPNSLAGLRQGGGRKSEFESLQNTMASAAPQLGRDIILTQEMYNSNILKGKQEAKREIINKVSAGEAKEIKEQAAPAEAAAKPEGNGNQK